MVPIELSHPAFSDANQARIYLENIRWPHGASCPCCGRLDPVKALGGDSMGPGWYHCGACRKKFTVRVGTVFERSHIALHKWLLGFRMYASSKKGPSARQLHQTLGITYRSAWFMARRIRAAMRDGDPAPRGGKDKVAEADERAIGPAKDVFVNERGWVKERGTAQGASRPEGAGYCSGFPSLAERQFPGGSRQLQFKLGAALRLANAALAGGAPLLRTRLPLRLGR